MYPIDGVEFRSTQIETIKSVRALDSDKKFAIDWERFIRLSVTARLVRERLPEPTQCRILDLNGWDGALMLFVPEYNIDVFVDATMGSGKLKLPVKDRSYDMIVSVGDIEHLPRNARKAFIEEISRVAKNHCLVGFPNAETMEAQCLAYQLTKDVNIKEHIDNGLPEVAWVESELQRHSFVCELVPCVSLAVWTAQFVLENVAPNQAAQVSAYLVKQHEAEAFEKSLYLIVSGSRKLA